jgi:hypothetical protein
MFSQIASRIGLALSAVVSVVIGLKLISAFLTPILGASLMHSVTGGALMLWNMVTPGLTALIALLLLAGLWWLVLGRRGRR